MNEIEVFKNSEFGEIRTVVVNDEPMFCLSDICKALELTQPSKVKERLSEKGVNTIPTLTARGTQNLLYINESNLYKTIFQSRKDNAEKFTDWVTTDVLPSIRKNGGYSMAKYQPKATSVGEVANLLKILERTMKAEKQSPEVIAKNIEQVCRQFGIELSEDFTTRNDNGQMAFVIVGVK